jgi:transposase-like protein
MNDEQVEQAAERYRSGASLAELGRRYDVDPQTVSRELKKMDVQVRPPGRWARAARSQGNAAEDAEQL